MDEKILVSDRAFLLRVATGSLLRLQLLAGMTFEEWERYAEQKYPDWMVMGISKPWIEEKA